MRADIIVASLLTLGAVSAYDGSEPSAEQLANGGQLCLACYQIILPRARYYS